MLYTENLDISGSILSLKQLLCWLLKKECFENHESPAQCVSMYYFRKWTRPNQKQSLASLKGQDNWPHVHEAKVLKICVQPIFDFWIACVASVPVRSERNSGSTISFSHTGRAKNGVRAKRWQEGGRGGEIREPSFPSPTPFLPPFCSRPIFRASRVVRKTNTRCPNFVRFVRERLLRRLISESFFFPVGLFHRYTTVHSIFSGIPNHHLPRGDDATMVLHDISSYNSSDKQLSPYHIFISTKNKKFLHQEKYFTLYLLFHGSSVFHQLKTKCMISGITPPSIRTKFCDYSPVSRLDVHWRWIKAVCVLVNNCLEFFHSSLDVAIFLFVVKSTAMANTE